MDIETTQNEVGVNKVDEIASLLMGGESTEVKKKPEEAEQGQAEGLSEDQGGDEAEDGEQPEGEETQEVQPEEGEITWSSVLGIDDSQIVTDESGNLMGIQVKVDGDIDTVSVKDLVAGYQTNKYNTQKSQALSADRKEFEKVRSEVSKEYLEKLDVAEKLTSLLDEALMADFSKIDWQSLRANNPGEFAALYAEFNSRKEKLDMVKATVSKERREANSINDQEWQQKHHEFVMTQMSKVIENNPSWSDRNKMIKDLQDIGSKAESTYGLTIKEFESIADARYIEILKDAVAYRAGKQIANNKVKTVPKFISNKGQPAKKPMDAVTKLTLNARKATGYRKRDLQAEAIAELLMGGKR